jgi:hypothetical protein
MSFRERQFFQNWIWFLRCLLRAFHMSRGSSGHRFELLPDNLKTWRLPMTAFVQAISRLTRVDVDDESLKTVLIFCGIGLLASLLAIGMYGLDLSGGLF